MLTNYFILRPGIEPPDTSHVEDECLDLCTMQAGLIPINILCMGVCILRIIYPYVHETYINIGTYIQILRR